MATSVGSVTCDLIDGTYSGPSTRARIWETPGVDGVGVMKLGQTSGRFQFQCIEFDSLSSLQTWADNIEALRNEAVYTITDSSGTAHTKCLIEDVSALATKAVIYLGASTFMGTLTISGHIRG